MGRLEALRLPTIDLHERTTVSGAMRYLMAMIHQPMHQLVEGCRTSNIYESFWWLCFLTSTSSRLDSDWRTAMRSSQRWIRCCWMDLCQQHFKLACQKPRVDRAKDCIDDIVACVVRSCYDAKWL